VISIALGVSLKSIWNLVTTLQFVIYFRLYGADIPANLDRALDFVKFIALGEFIDTAEMKKQIISWFSSDVPSTDDIEENFLSNSFLFIVALIVILLLAGTIYAAMRILKDQRKYEAVI
jgi:NhaP-type Na+/H+ or K+/H+ antiporter